MPSQQRNFVWGVDSVGRVHTLSTFSQSWDQRSHGTEGQLLEIKLVTATKYSVWAIGCDQELYIYVHSGDVPIRCQEYTYENQRWNPVHGFSSKSLLFADRPPWSDKNGFHVFPKPNEIKLPSKHWVWESDWHVEENIRGQPTGKGGWQYSVNFNTREYYTPEKKWNSCVRRRKWIRYRKYNASDVWAKVPGLNDEPMEEPFMDLAIGGYALPGQPEGYLSVWAITAPGQVYCRVGVTRKCPEGVAWKSIAIPGDKGIVQLSVGPTGMVWSVTWDGCGMVRTGVSRDNPLGTGWTDVKAPLSSGLSHVSVGIHAVWAITRDNKVWFRKDFEAIQALVDEEAATGSSWIEMIGKMSALTMGPSDQVWAIGYQDRKLYLRTGVSYTELSGRSWKLIDLPSKKNILDDTESLSESLSSLDSSLSSQQQPSNSPAESTVTQRSIRSVTMPSDMMPSIRRCSEDVVKESFMHEIEGRMVRTIIIQTDPPQIPQSEMPQGVGCLPSDQLPVLSSQSTASIATSPGDGSADDSSSKKTMPNSDGLTFEEFEADMKEASVSREGSWSSNYSDTIVNFVFDGNDSVEPVQFLDAECSKGTQTDWKDEEILRCQMAELEVLELANKTIISKCNEKEQEVWNTSNQCNESHTDGHEINSQFNVNIQDCGSSIQDNESVTNASLDAQSLSSEGGLVVHMDNAVCRLSYDGTSTSSDGTSFPSDGEVSELEADMPAYRHMTTLETSSIVSVQSTVADLSDLHDHHHHHHHHHQSAVQGNLGKVDCDSISSGLTKLGLSSGPVDRRLSSLQMKGRFQRSASEPMIQQTPGFPPNICSLSQAKLDDDDQLSSSRSSVAMSFEPDELMWLSISAGGCRINPASLPKWFNQSTVNTSSLALRIQEGTWRATILQLLKERQKAETKAFQHYPLAVERMSWVKVSRMQWFCEGKRHQWVDSTVELEKGLDSKGMHQSKLTLHYRLNGKPKAVRVLLIEVTCVMEVDSQNQPAMAIYTAKRVLDRKPIKLRFKTDKELNEWIAAISLACSEVRGLWGAPSPRSVWCVTSRGDVFVHDTQSDIETAPSSQMYWRQMGGHMALVASCGGGVVWGLGMDHTSWVYTGGYGGGLFKGIYSSTTGIYPQTDSRNIYIYENQRWNPIGGFSDRLFPIDQYTWTDEAGRQEKSLESVNTPSTQWQWVDDDWRIDFTVSTDKDGWQYSKDHKNNQAFHKEKRWNDYVRRRRWMRKCQLVTSGPWKEVPNLRLIDISIQVDVDQNFDGPISVWAVGANGDVVTRMGVTVENPEGTSWIHVPTDQPFISISVGGKRRVWAIAKDGSTFYRNGISLCNPTGDTWFHIAPPPIAPLKRISVGESSVWVIDALLNLWVRQNITPTFPEGTKWIHVSPKVRRVSVGPQNQVWILAEHVDGAKGVICRREGKTQQNPSGTAWDKGAGGGIIHLSIRSCTEEKKSQSPKMEDAAMATIQGGTFYANRNENAIKLYTNTQANALC